MLESQREYTRPTPEFQYQGITRYWTALVRLPGSWWRTICGAHPPAFAPPLPLPPYPSPYSLLHLVANRSYSHYRLYSTFYFRLSVVRCCYPLPVTRYPAPATRYFNAGEMISANEVRARLRRDFTVPRLHPVISAISS